MGRHAHELSAKFQDLFLVDERMVAHAQQVLDGCQTVLDAVRDTQRAHPGTDGMTVETVQRAAVVLNDQQQVLRPQVDRLAALNKDVEELITSIAEGAATDPPGLVGWCAVKRR